MNIYTIHNTIHHDPEITEGQSLLYLGTPSHTTCPYDTYARMLANSARKAFQRGGVKAEVHCCHRRISSVGVGSGRGGAVRMGDEMLPPAVQAVVASEDLERAARVWEQWQARRFFSRPTTVVGNLWYATAAENSTFGGCGVWRRGGTWPHVITNAIAIAKFLGRDATKIKAYAARREVVCNLA